MTTRLTVPTWNTQEGIWHTVSGAMRPDPATHARVESVEYAETCADSLREAREEYARLNRSYLPGLLRSIELAQRIAELSEPMFLVQTKGRFRCYVNRAEIREMVRSRCRFRILPRSLNTGQHRRSAKLGIGKQIDKAIEALEPYKDASAEIASALLDLPASILSDDLRAQLAKACTVEERLYIIAGSAAVDRDQAYKLRSALFGE